MCGMYNDPACAAGTATIDVIVIVVVVQTVGMSPAQTAATHVLIDARFTVMDPVGMPNAPMDPANGHWRLEVFGDLAIPVTCLECSSAPAMPPWESLTPSLDSM